MKDALFNAIRAGELAQVQHLLSENPELVKETDARGSTPLLLATYYGHEGITAAIIEKDDNLDRQDASGNTALMGVCFKGYHNINILFSKSN